MKYISRFIEKVVLDSSKTFKIVFLGGPRQVGKTTLLKKIAKYKKFSYVTLDDLNQRNIAKTDPALFLQQFHLPVIIDEVQYAPQLFPEIKKIVDQSDKRGQFWLTGSQQFSLIKNIQESLAGRAAILNVLGLSMAEKEMTRLTKNFPLGGKFRRPKLKSLFGEIFNGSFPVFSTSKAPNREIYFNSYIQTYIDRDLVGIFGIGKTHEFNRFIQVCAARTGQVLNVTNLARDCGVSTTTAIEWLGILENTMQIYLLKPYYPNITKRIIRSPKLYFLDTGLASYLTKWGSADSLRMGNMAGAFFETFVVSEIIKSFLFRGIDPSIYYLRDKEGHEVDLVIEKDGLHLIEVKLTATIKPEYSDNLEYFSGKSDKFLTKSILSLVDGKITAPGEVTYIPYTAIN